MNKLAIIGIAAALMIATAVIATTQPAFASTSSSFSVKQRIKQSISQSGFDNAALQIAVNNVGW